MALLFLTYLLCVYLLCCDGQSVEQFDRATANTSVWLSAAAYCETNTFMARTFKGFSVGFVTRFVIENVEKDVQGYVGYMPLQSAIYVVFRGSTSIEDWIGNIDVIKSDYPKCDDCAVHKGFYDAQKTVSAFIITAVKDLRAEFPTYTIITTGHSLGAAMATLTAIDLIESGLAPVRLFNFGSPRIGNHEFAEWASDYIEDHNRVTHYRDIVVHLPSRHRFEHITGEWYEDEHHEIHACKGPNDPDCSYQFYRTDIPDHMQYLTLNVTCAAVTADTP